MSALTIEERIALADSRVHCDGSGWFLIVEYPGSYWVACLLCNEDGHIEQPYDEADDPMPTNVVEKLRDTVLNEVQRRQITAIAMNDLSTPIQASVPGTESAHGLGIAIAVAFFIVVGLGMLLTAGWFQ